MLQQFGAHPGKLGHHQPTQELRWCLCWCKNLWGGEEGWSYQARLLQARVFSGVYRIKGSQVLRDRSLKLWNYEASLFPGSFKQAFPFYVDFWWFLIYEASDHCAFLCSGVPKKRLQGKLPSMRVRLSLRRLSHRRSTMVPPMKGDCYLRAPLESQSTNPNQQLIISWFISFVWFMLFIDYWRIQIMRNKYWEHVCECCKCCVASKKCGGLVKAFDVVVQRHLACLWTFMQRRSSWSCGARMSRWFYAWTP